MSWILTVWLAYTDPSLPAVRLPFPDRAACIEAQDQWDAAARAWLKRSQLWDRTNIFAVSRCDPPQGAGSLQEANLHTFPVQVPLR